MRFLGGELCLNQESYLGLPTVNGRGKYRAFSHLKERVWKRFQGWRDKLFSTAGKEILIKAVAQAIPTYAMNCFQLLVKLCKELNSLIGRFWWGSSTQNKIHWVKWQELC